MLYFFKRENRKLHSFQILKTTEIVQLLNHLDNENLKACEWGWKWRWLYRDV